VGSIGCRECEGQSIAEIVNGVNVVNVAKDEKTNEVKYWAL